MAHGATASLFAVGLISISQLLPCVGKPKRDYERFSNHAAERKCKSLYADLDSSSQARLDAHLKIVVDLALAAHDQHNPRTPTHPMTGAPADSAVDAGVGEAGKTSSGSADSPSADEAQLEPDPEVAAPGAPQGEVNGEDRDGDDDDEEDGDGDDDDEEDGDDEDEDGDEDAKPRKPKDPRTPRQKAIDTLREQQGKALFVALCSETMPPLPTLYRKSDSTDYIPIKVRTLHRKGGKAEISDKKKKKKKKKKKPKAGAPPDEADANTTTVRMVMERGRFRIRLAPLEVLWQHDEDGQLSAQFKSPILSLGVDTDGRRTPTYAYENLVKRVREGDCDGFYQMLDRASRARIERTLPMMIGFASALGKDPGQRAQKPQGSRELVVALCERSSTTGLQSSGVHLGEVVDEILAGNRATLSVQRSEDASDTHQVVMLREDGQWRLSIDTFASLGTVPPQEDDEDEDKDGQQDDEEDEGDEDDEWPTFP